MPLYALHFSVPWLIGGCGMVRGVRKTITEGGSLKYRPHFSMGTVYERSEKCDCKKDNSDCSIRWVTEEDESTGGYDVWVPGNLLLPGTELSCRHAKFSV